MATEDSTRCAGCGKEFYRRRPTGRHPRYCSPRCRELARPPRPRIHPHRCAECGAEFWTPKARTRFCSYRCSLRATGRRRSERTRTTFWARFWARVAKSEDCWLWQGPLLRDGYGQVSTNGRPKPAHRISWEAADGPIPTGLYVLHRCDTPACVRPEHLFLGTAADNYADSRAKGRNTRGPRSTSMRKPPRPKGPKVPKPPPGR
jgi:endogenous inhibitor of DNA gyrase (YacG/DUF329 family)